METKEILTNGMDAAEIVSEGFKMGKGTKIGLVTVGVSVVALVVYKTVKFFGKKKESEEMEDAASEHVEENIEDTEE